MDYSVIVVRISAASRISATSGLTGLFDDLPVVIWWFGSESTMLTWLLKDLDCTVSKESLLWLEGHAPLSTLWSSFSSLASFILRLCLCWMACLTLSDIFVFLFRPFLNIFCGGPEGFLDVKLMMENWLVFRVGLNLIEGTLVFLLGPVMNILWCHMLVLDWVIRWWSTMLILSMG